MKSGKGVILVLSAPTGGGKTTVARRLMEELPTAMFSVSHTTRAPRDAEVDGVDYHFVTEERFEMMVGAGEFAEWARVHGDLYGTSRTEVERAASGGADLILDIDVQGGVQIKKAFSEAVMVFIIPPSLEVLLERLRKRGSGGDFKLAERMRSALRELESVGFYDYIILNGDLDSAVGQVRCIVEAARARQAELGELAASLRTEVENWLRRNDVQGQ